VASRIASTVTGYIGRQLLTPDKIPNPESDPMESWLSSRIGNINRFPRADSLANYFGVTPGCRNSGEATQRLGSITKEGSKLVRFLLGQTVTCLLRADAMMREWYKRIKRRRGSNIARVAVMRRLVTIVWQMIKHKRKYEIGGLPRRYPEFDRFSSDAA
jgi:hypothetical protein